MSEPLYTLEFRSTVGAMLNAAAEGKAREIAVFGTRGDGKTIGALAAMIAHARRHQAAGYPLPVKWLGVADTFMSHTSKTHDSLLDPLWHGLWQLHDGGHMATFRLDGVMGVQLRLTGVEDAAGMDRLRTQCHGVWFEEPAPASVLVQSSGLSEAAWGLAMTSQRLPSHAHPAIMTLNYPDEDHWTWQRFHEQPCPDECARPIRTVNGLEIEGGCAHRYFYRIPPGELASAEHRREWERALSNRPDMLRRLLEGRPGSLMLGKQVAAGFSRDAHVRPCGVPDASLPLYLGIDGGESHTWATVIGQRVDGRIRVYAGLVDDQTGARQHFQESVIPWLAEYAPWALRAPESVRVIYDRSSDNTDPGNRDASPTRVMRDLLPGRYSWGPVTWAGRLDPVYALLNRMTGGRSVLEIDPTCKGLIRALDGGWYLATRPDGGVRRDTPHKPNHPHEDLGDAFCYFVSGVEQRAQERSQAPRTKGAVAFSPFTFDRPARERNPSKVDFSVFAR